VVSRARSARLVITHDTLTPGLEEFPDVLDRALSRSMDFFTPQVEGYARSNAPWTDRTGNARNGLRATTEHSPGSRHAIVLSHSVPYGIWLEVRWDGRYAAIEPTINAMGPQVMQSIQGLIGRM
jgi:hypothetical protein